MLHKTETIIETQENKKLGTLKHGTRNRNLTNKKQTTKAEDLLYIQKIIPGKRLQTTSLSKKSQASH
jgi:hypothetical protein